MLLCALSVRERLEATWHILLKPCINLNPHLNVITTTNIKVLVQDSESEVSSRSACKRSNTTSSLLQKHLLDLDSSLTFRQPPDLEPDWHTLSRTFDKSSVLCAMISFTITSVRYSLVPL